MKVTREQQKEKLAKFFVKKGFYKKWYYENGTIMLERKRFGGIEAVSLEGANEYWQEQVFLDKLDKKFCGRLYQLALASKEFFDTEDIQKYAKFLLSKYPKQKAYDICKFCIEEYRNENGGFDMPSTRELMINLAKKFF